MDSLCTTAAASAAAIAVAAATAATAAAHTATKAKEDAEWEAWKRDAVAQDKADRIKREQQEEARA